MGFKTSPVAGAYTEDDATPTLIVGSAIMIERDDQLSTVTPVAADWLSLRGTSSGALWVAIADSSGDPVTSFSGTQYNEDVASADANTGTIALVVRDDALSANAGVGTDGDFTWARVDNVGSTWCALTADDGALVPSNSTSGLKVNLGADNDVTVTGAALTALQLIDNAIHVDDAGFTLGTHSGIMMMGFAGTQGVNANDAAALACATDGALHIDDGGNTLTVDAPVGTPLFVRLSDGSSAVDPATLGSDTYTEATTVGSVVAGVRNDALAALAGTDNELAPFQMDAIGALYVNVQGAAYSALANNISNPTTALIGACLIGFDGTNWDRVRTGGTDSDAQATFAEGSMVANANINLFNGTTWDRARGTTTNGLDVDVTRIVSGAIESGALASGSVASGAIASGAVASGAIASGAFASGSIGADAIALAAIAEGNSSIAELEDADSAGGDTGVKVFLIRDDALAANMGVNADGDFSFFRANNYGALWTQPSAGNLGGCKGFYSNDLDQTEEDIASGACTVYGIYAWNATAAPLWLQIFNTNTVTVGTTAPTFNMIIPANADSDGAGVVIPIPVQGLAFSTALTMAITTGVGTDSGAPGVNDAGVFVTYQD